MPLCAPASLLPEDEPGPDPAPPLLPPTVSGGCGALPGGTYGELDDVGSWSRVGMPLGSALQPDTALKNGKMSATAPDPACTRIPMRRLVAASSPVGSSVIGRCCESATLARDVGPDHAPLSRGQGHVVGQSAQQQDRRLSVRAPRALLACRQAVPAVR